MLKDNVVTSFANTFHRINNLTHNWVLRAILFLLGLKVVLLQPQVQQMFLQSQLYKRQKHFCRRLTSRSS